MDRRRSGKPRKPFRKKKELSSPAQGQKTPERQDLYKSVFDASASFYEPSEPRFFPPEAFGTVLSQPGEDQVSDSDLKNASAWDVAIRYHEFKSKRSIAGLAKKLRHLSTSAILERAQEVLGAVVHPMAPQAAPWPELPIGAEQVDFDLEETLENSPLAVVGAASESDNLILTDQDIWMSFNTHRHQPIILSVDTSLSMTGEKLALTAVALAVVLLEFPDDPIGIVAFENEAKILKRPEERLSVPALVERFLDVPAQGYTHLEDGMRVALKLGDYAAALGKGRPPSVVLLTDGKYTAGKDPAYLAPRFAHLVVLKMGRERSSQELCQELARKGHGALREVDELEALPTVMYGVVKDLLRGRSIA